jgi:Ca-activated chloride channel family protein
MFKKTVVLISMLASLLAFGSLQAQSISFPTDSVKGPMCVVMDSVRHLAVPLSPKHSTFNIVITDGLAEITLTQLFVNDYGVINDIAYVFPLPHDAAIHAMTMEYRDSIYKAVIYEKQEAKQIYDSIVKTGGTAAILLQERPNVFQQRLANIAFEDSAWVQIKLTMPLEYNDGVYEMAIPTMVAKRYQSAGASPVPSSGQLWNPPADRDGQTLQINVLLQTGFSVSQLQSPTHPIEILEIDMVRPRLEDRRVITKDTRLDLPYNQGAVLKSMATYPNKDYVLRFSRAAADLDFTVASYFDTTLKTGYFYSNIFPDTSVFIGDRSKLDVVLLIDVSGSQNGWPLAKEKEIALTILDKLTPDDHLTVLSFSDNVSWCFGAGQSVPVTAENIARAREFISGLSTLGGTNLLAGVRAALGTAGSEGHDRFFIFLTDGFITNETAILDEIKNHPTTPTVFTFGAGNSLNRFFLDEAAKVGNGVSTEITQTEAVEPIVIKVWEKIESPQLRDITITMSGLDQAQLLLPQGTMLYRGLPVTLFGVYTEGGSHTVTITGTKAGAPVTLTKEVDLASGPTGNRMLPQVWARQMIRRLRLEEGTTTANKSHIIELSKQYQVLSDYTAFLAISPALATDDNRISQPTAVFEKAAGDVLAGVSVRMINRQLLIEATEGVYIEEVRIYDMAGRLVFRLPVANRRCTRFSWDGIMKNGMRLAKGRFILKIKTTGGFITRPLIWR